MPDERRGGPDRLDIISEKSLGSRLSGCPPVSIFYIAELYGRFVGGLRSNSCVCSMDSHRLAPFQQNSGSFAGVKTIAIALFSWEFAFFDLRCQTPVFWKVLSRLEIPLFLHFGLPSTDHSDTFLPGFSAFHYGRLRQSTSSLSTAGTVFAAKMPGTRCLNVWLTNSSPHDVRPARPQRSVCDLDSEWILREKWS